MQHDRRDLRAPVGNKPIDAITEGEARGATDEEIARALVERGEAPTEADAWQMLYHHRGDAAGEDVRIVEVSDDA